MGIKAFEDRITFGCAMFFVGLVITSIWMCAMGITSLKAWSVYSNADNYEKTVFAVQSLRYIRGQRKSTTTTESVGGRERRTESGSRQTTRWYASGVINGNHENFHLVGVLPRRPKDREDLASMVSIGDEIDVWYYPKAMTELRVLKYDEDIFRRSRNKGILTVLLGLVPMIALFVTPIVLKVKYKGRPNPILSNMEESKSTH